MYLFLLLCLTAIAIVVVSWIYLKLARNALDGAMKGDNRGKRLLSLPRSRARGARAWQKPVGVSHAGAATATGAAGQTRETPTAKSAEAASGVRAGAGRSGDTAPAPRGTATGAPAPEGAAKETSTGSAKGSSKSGTRSSSRKAGATSQATAKPAGTGKTAATKGESAGGTAARPAKTAAPAPAPAAAAGTTASPPQAPLFETPSGKKDKLTDIKGIGPVAERQLNEQGITTFAQIAALSADDIARIDAYMPFSDRQIRDWQTQARQRG